MGVHRDDLSPKDMRGAPHAWFFIAVYALLMWTIISNGWWFFALYMSIPVVFYIKWSRDNAKRQKS
jgi:hypothetical protein